MKMLKPLIAAVFGLSVIQANAADNPELQKAWKTYQQQCYTTDAELTKIKARKCMNILVDLAEKDFIPAMLELSKAAYYLGDKELAIGALIQAAELGDPTAQTLLSSEFAQNGDVDIAKDLLEKALKSKQDFPYRDTALFNLGVMYLDGSGVTQSYAKAADYFQQGAKSNHLSSLYELGNLHRDGNGVKQDFKQAAVLYRKAAEKGHRGAQLNLGMRYQNGEGVKQDLNEAIKWFERAAGQSEPSALVKLGAYYLEGFIVKQDIEKGKAYLRQGCPYAAETNCEDAEELIKSVEEMLKK